MHNKVHSLRLVSMCAAQNKKYKENCGFVNFHGNFVLPVGQFVVWIHDINVVWGKRPSQVGLLDLLWSVLHDEWAGWSWGLQNKTERKGLYKSPNPEGFVLLAWQKNASYHHPLWTLGYSSHGVCQWRQKRHGGDIQPIFLFILLIRSSLVFTLVQDALKQLIDDSRVKGMVHVHLNLFGLLLFLLFVWVLIGRFLYNLADWPQWAGRGGRECIQETWNYTSYYETQELILHSSGSQMTSLQIRLPLES